MPAPVALHHAPLDPAALRSAASDPRAGAVVVFEGCARNHHGGQAVEELAYEAFEPMALAQLESLRQEAVATFGLHACFIHHRLGLVPLTEAAVVVVCASSHRKAAFEAVAWIMEAIKVRVPIWKKEAYTAGEAAWVEGETRR